jgi:hypothetical protein
MAMVQKEKNEKIFEFEFWFETTMVMQLLVPRVA